MVLLARVAVGRYHGFHSFPNPAQVFFFHVNAHPDRVQQSHGEHGGLRRAHIAHFQQPGLDDALAGSVQVRVAQHVPGQGQFGFVAAQQGFGFQDVLDPRPSHYQVQRGLPGGHGGCGRIVGCLGVVHFLLVDRPLGERRFHSLERALGFVAAGDGRLKIGPGLANLLRPTAGLESSHPLPLRFQQGLYPLHFQGETLRFEPGEQLAGADQVPFVNQQLGHPFRGVHGQIGLAVVHVAVED